MQYTISNSYPRRFARLMLGLLLCGTGTYMTVQATAIGIGAWETFQTGLAMRTGFSFGNCTVMVSFAVIAVDLLLGGKIGFGTLINAVMLTFGEMPRSLEMLVTTIVPPAAFFFSSILLPVLVLFGLSVPGYACAMIYDPIFRKIEKQIAEEEADLPEE